MKLKNPLPKLALIQDEIPEHVQEFMQLTRLAELGRISGVVAHEINNPLMVVQGLTENIEMMMAAPNPDLAKVKLQLTEILKCTQRMATIIRKMHPSGSKELRFYSADLVEIVKIALQPISSQLPEFDVNLEMPEAGKLAIKCDISQVEQMVLNILSNAVKALQNLETGRTLRITFASVGGWHQLKIWNNGPAIPESARDKILRGGSALGLVVSKAIMEVHGGDLSFSSSDQAGTEFILSFPEAA